jgi:nitrile hydratase
MDGVHDMGGMHGFGSVVEPDGELVFHDSWEPRVFATQIRVWDSSAEVRYLVLPMRPSGTGGWSEDRLAEIVTRDSMIGTTVPSALESAPA